MGFYSKVVKLFSADELTDGPGIGAASVSLMASGKKSKLLKRVIESIRSNV